MGAGSKPLRPWQVCAGDVIGSGKRVEYVFERYGELYINASDEELVRQGKRTYGEELTRLYDLDLSGWRVIAITGAGAATRDEAGMTWGSRSDGAREGMNMGKEKIEEKDVRLLRYAVEQAFDGAMRDGALALLNRLVDSASEAANLEEELLNLKGEYQRSMENSKRGAFKRLDATYKRKCRREKRMAKGQMLCADGKPVMFGETLYGGDGRDWLIVGIAGAWSYDVYGLHVAHDGKKEKKPLRAEWLVHELTDAGEEV